MHCPFHELYSTYIVFPCNGQLYRIVRCNIHYVIDASYLGDYKIRVRFEDEKEREIDLSKHLDGPIFEPLKDLNFFKQFTVNHDIDTITWPNGADFSPDFLYEIGEKVSERLIPV